MNVVIKRTLSNRAFKPSLNYKWIKENQVSIAQNLTDRNIQVNLAHLLGLYEAQKALDFELGALKHQRNTLSATLMKSADKGAILEQAKALKQLISEKEHLSSTLAEELYQEARHLPNTIHSSVPKGPEKNALLVETIGEMPLFDFKPKDHIKLAALHDMLDIERAGKVASSRFYFLKNAAVLLELALTRYAFDICSAHGFTPVIAPDVIRTEVLEGCGFSPRSDDPQTYYLSTSSAQESQSHELCLAGTAEFPLAAMYANETIDLPIKMVASGHAFRAEGLAGSTNRGLYRVHQFTKVEMFALASSLESQNIFHQLISIQKEIFSGLELHFRILNMPTEELGAPAHIKYDMEAWMPGRNEWGEISSTSNCTDFQSRRLNIKSKSPGFPFVHTINGTACAIPRMIISILETHQQSDGSIYIPIKLRPYLLGSTSHLIPIKSQ